MPAGARREVAEVIHAFGTCPVVRHHVCALSKARIAYTIGARVALTREGGNATNLMFLSSAAKVQTVTSLVVDTRKRFLAVSYIAFGKLGLSFTTIHSLAQPRPTRAKTLVYEAPSAEHSCVVMNSCFSIDSGTLLLQMDKPDYTMIGYDWKSGRKLFSIELRGGLAVTRLAFSPQDNRIMATCGSAGHFLLWRLNGGEVHLLKGGGVDGLPGEDEDFTDMIWLSGDRIVLTSRQGRVFLISPAEMLESWDLSTDLSLVGGGEGGAETGNDLGTGAALYAVCSAARVAERGAGFIVGGAGGYVTAFVLRNRRYEIVSRTRPCSDDIVELQEFGEDRESGKEGQTPGLLLAATDCGDLGCLQAAALFLPSGGSRDAAGSTPRLLSSPEKPRGFRPALEAFQSSLGNGSVNNSGDSSVTTLPTSASTPDDTHPPAFCPIVRGFGVVGESVRCLAVCSRRRLLACLVYPRPAATCCKGKAAECAGRPSLKPPELRIWNYRTRSLLLRHPFLDALPEAADSGPQLGSVEGYVEGACPQALDFHPSGYTLAVGFEGFVSIVSLTSADGAITTDQDVITKGIFRCSQESESVLNHDPVTSLRFSSGGHLLAVATGKIVQILALYSAENGGKLGRVQNLSGHTSCISSIHWATDDQRLRTSATCGEVYEWEVGGNVDPKTMRQREFISKTTSFQGVAAGSGREGGVVAVGASSTKRGGGISSSTASVPSPSSVRSDRRSDSTCTSTPKALEVPRVRSKLFVFPKTLNASGEVFSAELPIQASQVEVTTRGSRFQGGVKNLLLMGSREGLVHLYDWNSVMRAADGLDSSSCGTKVASSVNPSAELSLHGQAITSLRLTADCSAFFTASEDGSIFMTSLSPARSSSNNSSDGPADEQEYTSGEGGEREMAKQAMEERLVLIDVGEMEVVRTEVKNAASALTQQEHSFSFKLDRARLIMDKEVSTIRDQNAAAVAGVKARAAFLEEHVQTEEKAHKNALAVLKEQQEKALSSMSAMYEQKLGQQAEAYLRLKMAFEDLGTAARQDAEYEREEKDHMKETFSETKRVEVEGYIREQATLREYVDFLKRQYTAMLKKEEAGFEKELQAMRARAHIASINQEKENADSKSKTLLLRKQLKVIQERMQDQAAREVEADLALEVSKVQVKKLELVVQNLEGELLAKNQRLSEWEHMASKQKNDMKGLDKLKSALSIEVHTQREYLQQTEAEVARLREKVRKDDALIDQGATEAQSLEKTVAERNRQIRVMKKQIVAKDGKLRHREASLLSLCSQMMDLMGRVTDGSGWLGAKAQCQRLIAPFVDKGLLDDVDPDASAKEQMRQRAKMVEGMNVMKRSMSLEQQNHAQQNAMRLKENLQLTEEMNELRRQNKKLIEAVALRGLGLQQKKRRKGLTDTALSASLRPRRPVTPLPKKEAIRQSPGLLSITKTLRKEREAVLGDRLADAEAKLEAAAAEKEQLKADRDALLSEQGWHQS